VFAIIQSGGRQVKVSPGDVVTVDRLAAQPGDEVSFDRVLLVEQGGGSIVSGSPYIEHARVVGTATTEVRGPKIRIFKKKRRKGYRRSNGHRAIQTSVEIKDILLDG